MDCDKLSLGEETLVECDGNVRRTSASPVRVGLAHPLEAWHRIGLGHHATDSNPPITMHGWHRMHYSSVEDLASDFVDQQINWAM